VLTTGFEGLAVRHHCPSVAIDWIVTGVAATGATKEIKSAHRQIPVISTFAVALERPNLGARLMMSVEREGSQKL
jgi:hypothetical protein